MDDVVVYSADLLAQWSPPRDTITHEYKEHLHRTDRTDVEFRYMAFQIHTSKIKTKEKKTSKSLRYAKMSTQLNLSIHNKIEKGINVAAINNREQILANFPPSHAKKRSKNHKQKNAQ